MNVIIPSTKNNHLKLGRYMWITELSKGFAIVGGITTGYNLVNLILKALSQHSHLLTRDNRKILSDFKEARQSSLIKRLFLFKRSGIYRQTLCGNLGLLLGVFLNKV